MNKELTRDTSVEELVGVATKLDKILLVRFQNTIYVFRLSFDLFVECLLPGGVTLDHLGAVVGLLSEELVKHPVCTQRFDPLLTLAALVAAAPPGGEGGDQAGAEEEEGEEGVSHGVTSQVTRDTVSGSEYEELVCEQ